ncbi:hypothetical protein J1614_011457 [Plenodomus biglobosus]|nr:hypothetical protein J1614_011457 [Plenodomus biglobosus]
MSSLTDTTNTVVLPHLSLFAGFCHPPTDTRRPDQMRDGTPRKINTNINATSPAEFDALPTYSDTEEDPEDHPPHHTHCAPPNHSASTASHLTPLLPRVTVVDLETSTSDAKHPSHTCDNNTDNNATQYASILTSFPRFRASSADACAREKNVRSTWSDSTWPLRAVLAVALLAVLGVAFAVDLAAITLLSRIPNTQHTNYTIVALHCPVCARWRVHDAGFDAGGGAGGGVEGAL